MWKWLHPYAKHETQYHLCGKLSPFFGAIAVLLLAVGIVWGLAYAPADYQQGNSFRIMYVHVPAAFGQWVCMVRWRLLRLCVSLAN